MDSGAHLGDWRPYLLGHWAYTEEWGWYWVADEEWGWITYHYGRWVLDRDFGLGWMWVPGSEWSPAWVSWRQGDEVIGWAPMPPDEIYTDVQDDPDFWLFVRASDMVAPAIAVVVLPAPCVNWITLFGGGPATSTSPVLQNCVIER